MYGLASELPEDIEATCFRAPHRLEQFGNGYAWFDISVSPTEFSFDPEGLRLSAALVLEELGRLRRPGVPLVIGGFSQGAMLAATVFVVESSVDAAWLMSGAYPPGLSVESRRRRVLVQHGVQDPVLPIELGRGLVSELQASGLEVTSREYPMGHTISPESLADGIEWLAGLR